MTASSRVIRSDADRIAAADAIKGLPYDNIWRVTVEAYKPKRSLAQNRLYWKWMTVLGDHFGYSREEMHEEMAIMFLEPREYKGLNGAIRLRRESTTKLNVMQFTEYLNNIDRFSISEHQVSLPRPEDLYNEAMGYETF